MGNAKEKRNAKRLYLGVDVGGTKVQASVVEESGGILRRLRCRTPRDCGADEVVAAIEKAMHDVLAKAGSKADELTAVGVAIPGVVEPKTGRVVITPNMNLSGVAIGAHLQQRFHLPVAVGNDCNLGTLGEKWLGSAREAEKILPTSSNV